MKELQVGYSRVNITPDYPVAMAGGAATRISEGALDPIYITYIALRQGEETILFATMDFVGTYEEFAAPVTTAISQAVGLPEDRIILNSTHSHSSVSLRYISGQGIARYTEDFTAWAIEGAKEALIDLSPANVYHGSIIADGMNWVRHYKMANGTYAGANYGSFKSSTPLGHAVDADRQMQLIKFARPAEGKKDIVLMSFPCHATMNQSSKLLSADFPGPTRDYIEEKTGVLVAYFIGAGGDQVPSSRIEGESFNKDYKIFGAELGRIAVECMKNMTEVKNNELRFSQKTYFGKSNKADMDKADEVLAIEKIWQQVGGRGTPEGKAAAKERGFHSVYEVTAILNRMRFAIDRTMELRAIAIGDISIIFAPYEMFGGSGKAIKEGSPYDMTFVVSCSHNHDGYLPSEYGCKIRCYEAQITKFEWGTAEKLVDEYISLLKDMKNQ
ncbi:MAG: hypothetical protein IKU07_04975 [Oscillospiraceae bacterium]|nr:hypothetical protein [Oscillospiraceae bacterium]